MLVTIRAEQNRAPGEQRAAGAARDAPASAEGRNEPGPGLCWEARGPFVRKGGGWLPATDVTGGVCAPTGSRASGLPAARTPSGGGGPGAAETALPHSRGDVSPPGAAMAQARPCRQGRIPEREACLGTRCGAKPARERGWSLPVKQKLHRIADTQQQQGLSCAPLTGLCARHPCGSSVPERKAEPRPSRAGWGGGFRGRRSGGRGDVGAAGRGGESGGGGAAARGRRLLLPVAAVGGRAAAAASSGRPGPAGRWGAGQGRAGLASPLRCAAGPGNAPRSPGGWFPARGPAARLGALREAVPRSCVPALRGHAAIWSALERGLFLEKPNFFLFFFSPEVPQSVRPISVFTYVIAVVFPLQFKAKLSV